MLSPSREVLLLRGARLRGRETTREKTGNIRADFHLWRASRHPRCLHRSSDRPIKGRWAAERWFFSPLLYLPCMCGSVSRIWLVRDGLNSAVFGVDALIGYPGPKVTDCTLSCEVYHKLTHNAVNEQRCENMLMSFSGWTVLGWSRLRPQRIFCANLIYFLNILVGFRWSKNKIAFYFVGCKMISGVSHCLMCM